jgi:hypothetical protein
VTERRETAVEFAERRHREGATAQTIGAELEARGVPTGVIAIALSTAGASSATRVDESSPYQRALKLKRQGLGAEAIAAQLAMASARRTPSSSFAACPTVRWAPQPPRPERGPAWSGRLRWWGSSSIRSAPRPACPWAPSSRCGEAWAATTDVTR